MGPPPPASVSFTSSQFPSGEEWEGRLRRRLEGIGSLWGRDISQPHFLQQMRKAPPLSWADQPPWGECIPLKLDCWELICAHH